MSALLKYNPRIMRFSELLFLHSVLHVQEYLYMQSSGKIPLKHLYGSNYEKFNNPVIF